MYQSNSVRGFSPWMGLIAAVALLGFYLLGLDYALLFDVDEGAFTEATREMLLSKDWGHTTLNGADRFDKPIGVYWLQALSASAFGLTEFSFRLPSALSAWAGSLALAFFAFEKWGRRAAGLIAVISATSLGPWAMARTATADALLGLCFVLIFLDLWRSLESHKIFYTRRLAIWMALGILVKGPVAVLVPVGSILVYALLTPSDRSHVKAMFLDAGSWLLLISISMPWYAYAYMRHGQNFIDGFLLKHNVERFTGSLEGHSGHWAYFLIALPLLWMPWSVLWFKSLMHLGSQWKQPLLKFSWVWFFFVFVFFTLANTKLPHYLLYAGPAMCLLILQSALSAQRTTWTMTWLLALGGLLLLILSPSYLRANQDVIHNEYYRGLFLHAPNADFLHWLIVIPLLLLISPFLHYLFRKFKPDAVFNFPGIGFVSLAFYQSCILSLIVLPWWSYVLQSPVHDLAIEFKNTPVTVVQWGVHLPSFATYRQSELPRREPLEGEFALVKNIKPYWPGHWNIVVTNGPLAVVQSTKAAK